MTDLLDQSALLDQAHRLVEAARRAGADAADAVAVRGIALGVQVRLGAVEQSERSEGDDFGLRVFVGRRSAIVSANTVGDADQLAMRAVAMARAAPEDPFAGLAEEHLLAREFPALDLVDAAVPDADQLRFAALAAEEAGRAVAGVTNSGGASASWGLGGMVLVTSHGFVGTWLRSSHSIAMTAIAGEGTGMERDWEASSKIHRAELEDPEAIGRKAGERAVRRLKPRQAATGHAVVIYDPRAATSLVGHLSGAINGAAVARKTSFLKDRMGERLFAEGITISDDPHRRRGLGSRPFDGEGVSGQRLAVIEDGILRHWLLDSASARELGLVTNGRAARGTGLPSPSSTNLTLEPGSVSRADMIGSVESGLYITDMIGSGVNGVTGDYSRGASGFWIEQGELTYPVAEITVAGNLRDMYRRLTPADDLEYRFGINAPTVRIEGLTIAGR
ncbi:TldD/PmbA family protein [Prosthecodimorpha staleyi]|uniref:TldD/PmbA family protein n=1 Tax=Prosthecodimorpha staleyi TaxID=2840188 RepID=A0A947GCQ5_9HYPH|nr:TldD/PmbA family protein [Prosthecodimorpha staleyi]MBT9289446.1 TldD/PmbA family protein [Prosthecodimorpha staleyi]